MCNKDIKYIEFSRVELYRNSNWRSFDIEIVRVAGEQESTKINLIGIDKDEYQLLVEHLRTKNIKMKIYDNVTNEHMAMEDFMQEEVPKKSRREINDEAVKELPDNYDSEEEDDDFNAGPQEEGEDDDEESEEEGSDEQMEEMSDGEKKEVKKENKKQQENLGKGQRLKK